MTETRRAALKKALIAAVAAATPASLLRAAGKVGTLKLPLLDGSDLEFTERTIFHVKGPGPNEKSRAPMRTAVVNGDFRMKGGGRILFARDSAERGAQVGNPAATAKFWVLKNSAGDELEFKVR
jgi:hypothetical protein